LSQRGALLLGLSHLAMRRDILSGTPMPQRPEDIQSQLDFLWPGSGLGDRIARGESPRAVLGSLYVRTTKRDLDLPPRKTTFVPVTMADAHKALYSVVRDEFRRRVSELRYQRTFDILSARKSVIRLLQASANPTLLVEAISEDRIGSDLPRLIQAVINEGPSTKVQKAVDMAREFAKVGRKCVIWTIFTDTLLRFGNMLADLRPVMLYGQVPSGSVDDEETREGRLEQFSKDPRCFALIANPAAASEGFSIHRHCHDAIYVDRSYNATHYLQSIDRIHRLGLPPETVTNVWVLQNQVPLGIGSIDYSVSRRLAHKIREMQRLLEDPDLHELALDEESAPQPIEADVDIQDIDDLIKELEGRPVEGGEDVV
jgi:SNF2 family DNA or RNA helicase